MEDSAMTDHLPSPQEEEQATTLEDVKRLRKREQRTLERLQEAQKDQTKALQRFQRADRGLSQPGARLRELRLRLPVRVARRLLPGPQRRLNRPSQRLMQVSKLVSPRKRLKSKLDWRQNGQG